MNYIDPPPKTKPADTVHKARLKKVYMSGKGQVDLTIRKAHISDVEEILQLINRYAAMDLMLPRGPQYIYENIRDFVVAVDEKKGDGVIAACCSLHIIWGDIAEIRAMAISEAYQHAGIGKHLVAHMQKEARELGVKLLFTFTLADEFFKKLGFQHKDRAELPSKVWGECSRCPKYFKCDEVGMVLEI